LGVVEVLERGDISFFWKPSVRSADALVGEEEAKVQSFFMVLSTGDKHRRVRVGKKRLPMRAGERLWARVERTGSLGRVLGDMVETERYVTKTRGERVQPGAEMIARGAYAFVQHDDHCHLAYRLDDTEPGVPEEVRVAEAGSLIVLFERVPRTKATWTTVGSPAMLDESGAECVLVGGADEPERELGIDLLAA
jgi:hypothetical protein